ncbi:flagellar operon protein [Lachnospiraceae bacterium PF1-21]|uniref:TIGR02530 family flagellar biosynthesis protein n=1 Tax=Ohessyouella blattaphilus TaxID=2949333 RepID=UPI003E242A88
MGSLDGLTSAKDLQLRYLTTAKSGMQVAARLQATNFSDLLQEKQISAGVEFSKHALGRIKERGLILNQNLMKELNEAVTKAKEKGAKEVAIIGTDKAFIVDVAHNRVVTAMNAAEMRESIFTNIDSAVLI